MRILLLLSCLVFGFHCHLSAKDVIHVSGRTGSDEIGDGSSKAPYRSVTRALEGLDPERAWDTVVRLDYGTYGPTSGEKLPIELPAGIRIQGLVAGATILEGEGNALLLSVTGGEESVHLDGLTLQGGGTGILLGRGDSSGGTLVLNGVQWSGLDRGLEIRAGDGLEDAPLRARVNSARAAGCAEGIRLAGDSAIELTVTSCIFKGCEKGIFLDGKTKNEKGVHHSLTASECLFLNNSIAGVLRQGEDGRNRTSNPYRFEDCIFQGNHVGLDFERPAGDSPVDLAGCSFLENTLFGLKVIGLSGDPSKRSRIQDSTFRWNGVGMQVMSTQVNYEIRRNRILDNLGNGVFCGNVLADPTTLLFTDNLIAHNGATGIYGLSDGRNLKILCINNTLVFNGAFGLKRHNKHGGESRYEIRNCIFAGNESGDLTRIDAEEARLCLIASGRLSDTDQNLFGDPGFADPSVRDYRLKADSACRDRGGEEGDARSGDRDLDGNARRSGAIDLGAFEYAGPGR